MARSAKDERYAGKWFAISKSMHRERIEENVDIFDFELVADEIAAIDQLDRGEDGRVGPNPETFDWIPSSASPSPQR